VAVLVVASEGFIGAPPEVIGALVRAILARKGKDRADLAKVRAYTCGREFAPVLAALDLAGERPDPKTLGRHHDLRQVFDRVNGAYFEPRLDRPVLIWNSAITRRKVGHYQPVTDTVMISVTLDDARVPDYVVEFVMYHELLHKHLGTRVIKGRRYAHSAAFRQAEKRFRHYDQAQSFLTNLGRRMRLD